MQEKELIAVWRELKILSLGKPGDASYPRDGIVNPHLTTIKGSYSADPVQRELVDQSTLDILRYSDCDSNNFRSPKTYAFYYKTNEVFSNLGNLHPSSTKHIFSLRCVFQRLRA